MSFQDLSITGSPTPRADSRRAVSARNQRAKLKHNVGAAAQNTSGGAVVTKDQIDLARKLAYYETEVEKVKKEMKTQNQKQKEMVVQQPIDRRKAPQRPTHEPIVQQHTTGASQPVPPLKLNLLRQEADKSYHVTRGADSARSVLSWGDDSVRETRQRPQGISKIQTKGVGDGGEKEKENRASHFRAQKVEMEKTREAMETVREMETVRAVETARAVENQDGDIEYDTGQELGFYAYETEESQIKRGRQEQTVETQMVQDLTQPETTDEQPNSYSLRTPWATSERADFYALKEIPRVKRIDNSLHVTSKELTFENLKDRGIEKRLKFRLRVISRCGRDCLRDLHAFYFQCDDSIAIYEYREIGKRVTAAPLFKRDVYRHPRGPWIGNAYTLRDIKIGATLHFPTNNNPALPPSVTRAPFVLLRVTEVSKEDVLSLVYDDCRIEERAEREEIVKVSITPEQIWRIRNLELIQGQIKEQLKSRPLRSLVGLGHYFLLHDKDKDGFWRADELQAVLRTFRIKLSHQDFVLFWNILDEDGSGLLDVGEFFRGLLGEMSEARVGMVHRAWLKMDPGKVGEVSFKTVRQFYNPAISLDPDTDGNSTKEQLIEEFLECFSAGPLNQKITYCEFVDYYSALSLSEEADEVFLAFMRHCWNV